jgi:hypothetical protein
MVCAGEPEATHEEQSFKQAYVQQSKSSFVSTVAKANGSNSNVILGNNQMTKLQEGAS